MRDASSSVARTTSSTPPAGSMPSCTARSSAATSHPHWAEPAGSGARSAIPVARTRLDRGSSTNPPPRRRPPGGSGSIARTEKSPERNPMAFELPPLPYAKDALAPHISAETLEYHHGKHHATYVNNLNGFVKDDPSLAGKSLEDLIRTSSGKVFNNAAQVWNHTFYWHSMKPGGGGQPTGAI